MGPVAGDYLNYGLYQPGGSPPPGTCPSTTAWGTTIGTDTLSLSAPTSKAGRLYNVCGTIPANQDVAVGAYSDTVSATINF